MSDGLREALEKLRDEWLECSEPAAENLEALLLAHPVEPASEVPELVVVHHHDIERHAEHFNEGYDEAQRQGIGGEASRNWLTEKVWPLLKDHIDPENSHHVADQLADALLSEADIPVRGIAEGGGITAEAVEAAARTQIVGRWDSKTDRERAVHLRRARRALDAAVPLLGLQQVPSREEIGQALHDEENVHPWGDESCVDHGCEGLYLARATTVLALFSKPAEEGSAEAVAPGQWLHYQGNPSRVDHRALGHTWHPSTACTPATCGATPEDAGTVT